MSMLPLEVLPGWPEPAPVSDLYMILLTVVGPLAFAAIVAALAFGPKLARRQREAEAASSTELEPVQRETL